MGGRGQWKESINEPKYSAHTQQAHSFIVFDSPIETIHSFSSVSFVNLKSKVQMKSAQKAGEVNENRAGDFATPWLTDHPSMAVSPD